jgi:hypothetical protein
MDQGNRQATRMAAEEGAASDEEAGRSNRVEEMLI